MGDHSIQPSTSIKALLALANSWTANQTYNNDVLLLMGTGGDIALLDRSTTLAANTALTNVLIGTPVSQAIAADSFIISNTTASGDIVIYGNLGGNSQQYVFIDTSAANMFFDRADVLVRDGNGEVIGNDSQETAFPGGTAEFQVLGTAGVDSAFGLARYSADAASPGFWFLKSRAATIGSRTAVNSGDTVAEVAAYGAGTSTYRLAGYVDVVTESAGGGSGVAGAWIFYTGTTTTTIETLRLNSTQNMSFRQGATSPVLDAAVADVVSIAAVDTAAGDRRLYIQPESGSALILGNDRLRFAATTGILGIGATDVLSMTSTAVTLVDPYNIVLGTTTGTKIGTATTQKLAFYNSTPIVQGTAVADASGGATIDAEARTAINNLLARVRSLGLIAT